MTVLHAGVHRQTLTPKNKMKKKSEYLQELAGHDVLPPVHVILAVEC